MLVRYLIISLGVFFTSLQVQADLLEDVNGDELVVITSFGDSITYGVGDGVQPGAFIETAPRPPGPRGYPERVELQLGINVDNEGNPGELLTETGYLRFPAAVQKSFSDIVLIMEGTNDATLQKSPSLFRLELQQIINVSIALGKLPILMTVPPPCCSRGGSRPFARALNNEIRNKAAVNDLVLIDIERAWDNTCPGAECYLYNLPEGLHPNDAGYTLIAQTVMAGLLEIDINSPGGASELEDALGLEEGQVIVLPDPQPVEEMSER